MTKYAREIEAIVLSSAEHMTEEQIYMQMKKKNSVIAQASVYNNLRRLTESGRLNRISISGHPDRYDIPIHQDHLFCDVCGEITDVTIRDLKEAIEKRLGVDIISYNLGIHYVCPKCRKNRSH